MSRERDSKRSDRQLTKDIHIRLWKYYKRKYLYNRLILALCSNCRRIYIVVMSKCKEGLDHFSVYSLDMRSLPHTH